MNETKLSKRLKTVADFVKPGSSIADIGSDHAYLPSYLCVNGQIHYAVAGEVNEGPYQSALTQVKKLGISNQVHVRKGNGLEVISPQEVEHIIIAGMGGALITEILEAGSDKLEGVNRLILQPNVMADRIRVWLKQNGWELKYEVILEEDEKIYEILVAERGNVDKPYSNNIDLELLLGPFLMREKNAAFIRKWTSELYSWKRILNQFEQAKETGGVQRKKEELTRLISKVEEVIST
ncbi:tRNA (adenine(22)-N(1))-methyltransferase [Alkalihalobacterium alkalinitrilicum]|uniref:tRNA (adenine(22)-N(1))-methyltransferase n=1 Tax=Alkalihalobacterium alkalinitrilicum TaxID=427920 RepID=UPI000994BA40|nr:tRNA (adenine(22)-N(1))-methyltransferase TrmK [Alkalihalobacterium alkalinitrilicum]